ncbi:hypothetical protein K469DRAFT_689625 [Zopfia rhizophila CBS 207.26]|uniref:Uncharacterized protein n=1 Tax=Zopfia rhizophila CBS 207.26 TaxID=1314779 RepID=A0A6A6DWB9_9PEZI|nr:hypothetical protein K469DRAFT_689625 [Zopfia rhizophila CBS 207.26]
MVAGSGIIRVRFEKSEWWWCASWGVAMGASPADSTAADGPLHSAAAFSPGPPCMSRDTRRQPMGMPGRRGGCLPPLSHATFPLVVLESSFFGVKKRGVEDDSMVHMVPRAGAGVDAIHSVTSALPAAIGALCDGTAVDRRECAFVRSSAMLDAMCGTLIETTLQHRVTSFGLPLTCLESFSMSTRRIIELFLHLTQAQSRAVRRVPQLKPFRLIRARKNGFCARVSF